MYYLDHAATSYPKPPNVWRAAMQATGNPGRGGHALSRAGADILYNVRQKAADFFGADPTRVVFTQNATHALNLALSGARGDVITSDLEHNAVRRPLENNPRVRRIMVCVDGERTLPNFASALRGASLCCVTAQSNVTGQRLPIREIALLCKERGVPLIVDASQGAGVMDLSVDRDHIAMLCTAGHKGLYGLMGSGLLILGEGVCPSPLLYGGSGGNSVDVDMPPLPPERLEAGTLNLPAIASLGAGLDFIERRGRQAIDRYEKRLASCLRDVLDMPRIRLYGECESGTFLFNIDGIPSEEVAMRLDEAGIAVRAGLHCAPDAHKKLGTFPDGGVRVSVGALQGNNIIEKFYKEIKKIVK